MTLRAKTINLLQEIVGPANVLTDIEDIYVYSFEQIYREQRIPKLDAVVRTECPEEIIKVGKLADEDGFTVAQRGKAFDLKKISKPIVVLDDFKPLNLEPLKESEKVSTEAISKFRKTEIGTLKKLAFAQKLMFLNKPTTKCQECDACSSYCTAASSFNNIETWSAKGRLLLIKAMSGDELSVSPKLVDVIYTCSNCGLCFSECLQHSEFQEAIRAARRKIVLKDLAPQIFKAAAENILEVGDPGGVISQKRRLSWLRTVSKPGSSQASLLYWVGCTVAARTPNTAKAVINILNSAGASVALLGEREGCCGYLLLASGLWDEAKKNAIRIIERVRQTGVELMVTPCAGCYYTFSRLFPEILDVEMPCRVLHVSQFLEDLLGEGMLDLKGVESTVTYHDPCSLGRHSDVYDAPRNVLAKILELQFVELPLSKSRSRCCGGGGGLWSYNNRVSLDSASTRLMKDVVPLNVNVLTTACPVCQMNLRYASIRNSIPVKVCDFTEIVEIAMGKDYS